eukprot:8139631-Pyramimonas_sp.AAC.1
MGSARVDCNAVAGLGQLCCPLTGRTDAGGSGDIGRGRAAGGAQGGGAEGVQPLAGGREGGAADHTIGRAAQSAAPPPHHHRDAAGARSSIAHVE